MKRITYTVLCFVIIVSLFVGCGSQPKNVDDSFYNEFSSFGSVTIFINDESGWHLDDEVFEKKLEAGGICFEEEASKTITDHTGPCEIGRAHV